MSASLARRYVKPLFEVARDKDQLDKISADLNALAGALAGSPDLHRFLASPSIDRAAKKEAMASIFKGASPYSINFLNVVIEKSRTEILVLAHKLFDEMLNLHRGVMPGMVESAVEMSDSEFKTLSAKLETRFGGNLELERKVDPLLIGGVHVRAGNRVLDASVKGRLEKLKAALVEE